MQVVSTCGGPNLTSCQFWATRGQIPEPAVLIGLAGMLGFAFGYGDGNGGQGTTAPPAGLAAPAVVLQVPIGGNTAHALDDKSFSVEVMGQGVTWTLKETPVGATDIAITNGDTAAQVATKLAAGFAAGFQVQYGFRAVVIFAFPLAANADGSVNVAFYAVDAALTGAVVLDVQTPLTMVREFAITNQYGFPMLRTASKTWIYQGLGEPNLPAGTDASLLNIMGRPVSAGRKAVWVARIGTNVLTAPLPP